MIAAEKRQIRAAEYRRLERESSALALTSALGHVREKHERASAQWAALAAMDERPRELVRAADSRQAGRQ